jgi:hypothetical protein
MNEKSPSDVVNKRAPCAGAREIKNRRSDLEVLTNADVDESTERTGTVGIRIEP